MIQNGNVLIVNGDGEKEMSEMGKDTRKKSLTEAFVNSFGSYPIGYGIGILILPVSTGWLMEDPFVANIFITMTFATVSFVRVYFLRRLFLKLGFDDNFLKLGIKLFQKISIKVSNFQIITKYKQSSFLVRGVRSKYD